MISSCIPADRQITRQCAFGLVERQGYKVSELIEDMGDRAYYALRELLAWMGY